MNNHFSIFIYYRNEPEEYTGSRIVGFEVFPKSVSSKDRTDCSPKITESSPAPHNVNEPSITYTYSIEFKEENEITWANRWNLYLSTSDPQIHWYSIINSLIILMFLSAMVAIIMLRTLNNDITIYNEEDLRVCFLFPFSFLFFFFFFFCFSPLFPFHLIYKTNRRIKKK